MRLTRATNLFTRYPLISSMGLLFLSLIGCVSQDAEVAVSSWEHQLELLQSGASNEIDLDTAELTDQDARALTNISTLRRIWIEHATIKPEALQILAESKSLKQIKLGGLGDEHSEPLAAIESLQVVNLPHSTLSDAGLETIASLPNLQLLRLQSPHVSDAGMKTLPAIATLKWVHLIDVPITDAGLDALAQCENLESLYLDGCNVSDAGMSAFVKRRRDVHVHFNDMHVADDPSASNHTH